MRKPTFVFLLLICTAAIPGIVHAQLFGGSARTGAQWTTYKLGDPLNQTVSEFTLPLAFAVPLGERFTVDLAGGYASVVAKTATERSVISGFTDTQLRVNFTMGQDAVVLTAGVNLPTGKETIDETQLLAAGLLGNDFLSFPVSNFGTGLAATGGIAVAKSIGEWNWGLASGYRRSSTYEPARIDTTLIRFTPGDEYRIRLGADRALGPGQIAAGLTYSTFGKDIAGAFSYNTGDRYISQLSYSANIGDKDISIYGWDLYRTDGLDATGSRTPVENILNLGGSLGFNKGTFHWEPNIEGRTWRRNGINAGLLATLGLRMRSQLGPFTFMPGFGMTAGKLSGAATDRASLKGWNGSLTIRLTP